MKVKIYEDLICFQAIKELFSITANNLPMFDVFNLKIHVNFGLKQGARYL
jgi:hypothetical protein